MQERTGGRLAIVAHAIFDGAAMRGPCALLIEEGRIAALGAPADASAAGLDIVELEANLVLAPGLVDCQVNGGAGLLVNDAPALEAIRAIVAAHQSFGATSVLPTLITDGPAAMERLCAIDPREIAGVPGFHLEGPFINTDRRGVHAKEHVRALA
ncbi:MAG: N-acetylglucosamine-6-phosphate deacetylase, partial [Beijerinckiaceae bacterium]|nr:N-acetylglucosamine-6-phosphate deacetylase [Beijerinckiaceae bacterium]